MKQQHKIDIILSGGGTGGHVFPAIAVAQELLAQRRDLRILFVGAVGKMEMKKVPAAGFEIVGLPISAFHRRLTWKNILFPIKLV
ncbi:MAG: UDP-N-acetylglucosamine--N-acetylmuramyl-(pentapeptide) pyrophosphoryl-undecaprenol N-acetylglucosamine transferase, partial [Bacteroidetes bacterium]|nr:UDP-N-acetylglucosamine--N-acetylmuramyl-(pentapeptide) pyrophosphoryl-undecaprenol N-acetylglucosamine transferase [Bacteroidota bacterium]